jgi:hypothetical protein
MVSLRWVASTRPSFSMMAQATLIFFDWPGTLLYQYIIIDNSPKNIFASMAAVSSFDEFDFFITHGL